MSLVGTRIGHIRIEDRLGRGGMGEVFLGFDEVLERRVAVKTLRTDHRLGGRAKSRFLREARLLSRLGHPGICQVYDVVETPDADYLVLEYVPGQTLRAAAAAGLELATKLTLAGKIARALAVAHRAGIVHRDLKAENIMVTPEGEVKILDFGIARIVGAGGGEPPAEEEVRVELRATETVAVGGAVEETRASGPESADESRTMDLRPGSRTRFAQAESRAADVELAASPLATASMTTGLTRHGMVLGTLAAMSPEQAAGGRVTEASDLYSLGILLQTLFTERPAYAAEDVRELWAQVLAASPAPIVGLDADLAALIRELEQADPLARPGAELVAARIGWIADKPTRELAQRRRRRRVIAAFVALLVVLAVVSVLAWTARQARGEAEVRRQQAEELIGFMLEDLRPKLEQVGRVDLLDDVADRALAYFQRLPEADLSDRELAKRVEAILHLGEVRRAQGKAAEAMAAFEWARTLAAAATERHPDDEELANLLCDAAQWIGQVHFDRGETAEALTAWLAVTRTAEAAHAARPASRVWLSRLIQAYHDAGTARDAAGDLDSALTDYRRSLELQGHLPERTSYDLGLEAATRSFLSRTLERRGDLAGARRERETFLGLQEKLLAEAPQDASRQLDTASARGFLAGLLAVLGEPARALELYRSGLAVVERLAVNDPENADVRRWQGTFLGALGALSSAQATSPDARQEAGRLLARSCATFAALVAQDATYLDWRQQLGACHLRLAQHLARQATPTAPAAARAAASRELAAALPTLRQAVADSPDVAQRASLANAELLAGRLALAAGDREAASGAWQAAGEALTPIPRPITDWRLLLPTCELLVVTGRWEEAKVELDRLAATGFVGSDLAELRRRLPPGGQSESQSARPSGP